MQQRSHLAGCDMDERSQAWKAWNQQVVVNYFCWPTIFDSQGFSVHPAPRTKWTENPWLALMLPKNSSVKFFLFNLSSMITYYVDSEALLNVTDSIGCIGPAILTIILWTLCYVLLSVLKNKFHCLRIIFVINYYAKKTFLWSFDKNICTMLFKYGVYCDFQGRLYSCDQF